MKADPAEAFDGETYQPALDYGRLSTQLQHVAEVMRDGGWRTLGELQQAARYSENGKVRRIAETSLSARLRDLRKQKNWPERKQYLVDRRRRQGGAENGVWEYRLRITPRW